METDGGGWTVIQKRVGPQNATDHRISFFLNYTDYENGFGNANDEYWIVNIYTSAFSQIL